MKILWNISYILNSFILTPTLTLWTFTCESVTGAASVWLRLCSPPLVVVSSWWTSVASLLWSLSVPLTVSGNMLQLLAPLVVSGADLLDVECEQGTVCYMMASRWDGLTGWHEYRAKGNRAAVTSRDVWEGATESHSSKLWRWLTLWCLSTLLLTWSRDSFYSLTYFCPCGASFVVQCSGGYQELWCSRPHSRWWLFRNVCGLSSVNRRFAKLCTASLTASGQNCKTLEEM